MESNRPVTSCNPGWGRKEGKEKKRKEKKRKNKCLGAGLKGPYLGDRDATKT